MPRLTARLQIVATLKSFTSDQLVRTSWPLIVNTGFNALLGVAYWVVAARLFPQASVGTNLAVIAAMTTLSGIAQLNLGPSLAVLVPRAGRHARRLILQVYLVVTGFGAAAVLVFLVILLPHLAKLSQVLDTFPRQAMFAGAVLIFNLFALQDAALVALRRGKLIPVENTIFGLMKIGLLFAFASTFPGVGIFASWFVPMLVIVPVVSGVIFLARSKAIDNNAASTVPRDSLRKLAHDYLGYLFQVASTFFLPVLALELLDPTAAAVFAVAWLTSSTLDLLATNVGTALAVETSYGGDPSALRRTVFRRALPLVAVIAMLGLLTASLILRLYGEQYSATGVHTLQVLLLASVPRSLVTFAIAEARAHRNVRFIVGLRAQNSVIAIGLSFLLAPKLGVLGMALAWLTAQTLGGLVALRHMRSKIPDAIGADVSQEAGGETLPQRWDRRADHPVPRPQDVFAALEAARISWVLLRGRDGLGQAGRDVDLLIDPRDLSAAEDVIFGMGGIALPRSTHLWHRFYVFGGIGSSEGLTLDIVTTLTYGRGQQLHTQLAYGCLARNLMHRGVRTLNPTDMFWTVLLHCALDKQGVNERRAAELLAVIDVVERPSEGQRVFEAVCPPGWSPDRAIDCVNRQDWAAVASLGKEMLRRLSPGGSHSSLPPARSKAGSVRRMAALGLPRRLARVTYAKAWRWTGMGVTPKILDIADESNTDVVVVQLSRRPLRCDVRLVMSAEQTLHLTEWMRTHRYWKLKGSWLRISRYGREKVAITTTKDLQPPRPSINDLLACAAPILGYTSSRRLVGTPDGAFNGSAFSRLRRDSRHGLAESSSDGEHWHEVHEVAHSQGFSVHVDRSSHEESQSDKR